MAKVTVIIPVANYHRDIANQAVASVERQTMPALPLLIEDAAGRGAGWARNAGLARVTTPFVVFLDADDTLEPQYIASVLQAFDGRNYIYTDWYEGDTHVHASDCCHRARPAGKAGVSKSAHLVTALLPTEWVRQVGGFDVSLPAAEDTDFYLKLFAAGHCGKRLAQPLFSYRPGGHRSQAFINDVPVFNRTMHTITKRYEGLKMGCCGQESQPKAIVPIGTKQDGDVLAQAQWRGNRTARGRKTGRHYPRTAYPKQVWVAPEDIDANPNLWKRVKADPPPLTGVDALEAALTDVWGLVPPRKRVQPADIKPDFERVLALYGGLDNA